MAVSYKYAIGDMQDEGAMCLLGAPAVWPAHQHTGLYLNPSLQCLCLYNVLTAAFVDLRTFVKVTS